MFSPWTSGIFNFWAAQQAGTYQMHGRFDAATPVREKFPFSYF